LSAVEETETATEYPEHGSELFYDLAKDRLSTQLDTLDGVDAKLGMLFSASSVLVGILVAVFTIRGNVATLGVGDFIVISISGALYLLAGYLTYRSYRPQDWKVGPPLQEVWDVLNDPDIGEDTARWRVGVALWSNYDDNLPAQKEKADRLPYVVITVIAQVLALCAALGLVAAGG
jgi:hypothetical protein